MRLPRLREVEEVVPEVKKASGPEPMISKTLMILNMDEGWLMNLTNLCRKLKKTRNFWRIWKTSSCVKESVIDICKPFLLHNAIISIFSQFGN